MKHQCHEYATTDCHDKQPRFPPNRHDLYRIIKGVQVPRYSVVRIYAEWGAFLAKAFTSLYKSTSISTSIEYPMLSATQLNLRGSKVLRQA